MRHTPTLTAASNSGAAHGHGPCQGRADRSTQQRPCVTNPSSPTLPTAPMLPRLPTWKTLLMMLRRTTTTMTVAVSAHHRRASLGPLASSHAHLQQPRRMFQHSYPRCASTPSDLRGRLREIEHPTHWTEPTEPSEPSEPSPPYLPSRPRTVSIEQTAANCSIPRYPPLRRIRAQIRSQIRWGYPHFDRGQGSMPHRSMPHRWKPVFSFLPLRGASKTIASDRALQWVLVPLHPLHPLHHWHPRHRICL